MPGHRRDHIKRGIGMAGRQQPAEVGVALGGLSQQDRAPAPLHQRGAHDRPQARLPRNVHETDDSVQPIGVGQREGVGALAASRLTQLLQRGHTLHGGVEGMGVQVDKRSHRGSCRRTATLFALN